MDLKTIRLISVLAVAVMAASASLFVLSAGEGQDTATQRPGLQSVTVTTWDELQDAIDSASEETAIVIGQDLAADDRDRILVEGKKILIDLKGHKVDRQRTSTDTDGHVFEVKDGGELTIEDSEGTGTITGGFAKNGGGINIGQGSVCTIQGGTIRDNSQSIDGGAVFVHGTLIMTGGVITNNYAQDTGGAIYCADTGTINLNGVWITGNRAGNAGGAMNIHMGSDSKISDCTISENVQDEGNGGAVRLQASGRTLRISDTHIELNSAGADGGGIYAESGTLMLYGCDLTDNRAAGNGGGMYCTADVTVDGGTFSSNTAVLEGGAVLVTDDTASKLSVCGDISIRGNSQGRGQDVYLLSTALLDCGNFSEGADIGISLQAEDRVFTVGYPYANPGIEPKNFFTSTDGYQIVSDATGEALTSYSGTVVPDPAETFIDWRSQINTDPTDITGRNWMSGISGERYLNEINIPGTHDSVTNVVDCIWYYKPLSRWANTQVRYIDEQLDDGARWIDVRLNNLGLIDGSEVDDGFNLYLCHGKTAAGTYYGQDHDGNSTTLETVLEWVKVFLWKHPTETVILDMSPEVDSEETERIELVYERLHQQLENLSRKTNPATGEPYLYMQDGVFGKAITEMPQLKNCRGKIIIQSSERTDYLGSLDFDSVGLQGYGQEGGYKDTYTEKIQHVEEFYNDPSRKDLSLLTDAASHYDFYFQVGFNCTKPQTWTPLELVQEVIPALFEKDGLFDRHGIYYGFMKFDGLDLGISERIWSSNFFEGLQYCTVTARSNIEGCPDQVYLLLKGTSIIIPGCIYGDHEGFIGWQVDGTDVPIGSSYIVNGDVVFDAVWHQKPTVYTVTFDGNGGTPGTQTMTTGVNGRLAELPSAELDGHHFVGWYTERTEGRWVNLFTIFTEDTVVYAHWSTDPRGYTVTFDGNGGTPEEQVRTAGPDGRLTDLPDATYEDFFFTGWFTLREGGERIDLTNRFFEDTTVYAHWSKKLVIYTVVFDGNGGTPDTSVMRTGPDGKLAELPSASMDGYSFTGWYTEKEGGEKIAADHVFTENATLYAGWDRQNASATVWIWAVIGAVAASVILAAAAVRLRR